MVGLGPADAVGGEPLAPPAVGVRFVAVDDRRGRAVVVQGGAVGGDVPAGCAHVGAVKAVCGGARVAADANQVVGVGFPLGVVPVRGVNAHPRPALVDVDGDNAAGHVFVPGTEVVVPDPIAELPRDARQSSLRGAHGAPWPGMAGAG
jgi:hypothetical protein